MFNLLQLATATNTPKSVDSTWNCTNSQEKSAVVSAWNADISQQADSATTARKATTEIRQSRSPTGRLARVRIFYLLLFARCDKNEAQFLICKTLRKQTTTRLKVGQHRSHWKEVVRRRQKKKNCLSQNQIESNCFANCPSVGGFYSKNNTPISPIPMSTWKR